MRGSKSRGVFYYAMAAFFGLFVLFLYGPMFAIIVLSFQGPDGGLTFPMNGFSFHWFGDLFKEQRVGDFKGSFLRSFSLALLVMILTVVISLAAGLAYRKPFRFAGTIFYVTVASLIVPSILITLGVGLIFDRLGLEAAWFTSGMGAHLTWTLPFGLLIMFAIFNRFDKSYEEAARDLGATPWQVLRFVIIPIIGPSLVGVGLFGFTLSFDEFARSLLSVGSKNTLPLEIFGMTTTVTTPTLYALGTLTTAVSFLIIGISFSIIAALERRRRRHGSDAGEGMV
ncbi:MAG: ABC transporter permease [Pseudomonadota bacterium]|nr:ABC transporter permease [Pseudomonadota bacterium]MEC8674936.1 ABC transporter permease [Pseudomonadota bacterium]